MKFDLKKRYNTENDLNTLSFRIKGTNNLEWNTIRQKDLKNSQKSEQLIDEIRNKINNCDDIDGFCKILEKYVE